MDDTTEAGAALPADEWHYTKGGQRIGPVSLAALQKLLADRSIDADTPVWRKGMPDWQPLRNAEIKTLLGEEPPPVLPSQINNGLVWALAVAPIVYGIISGLVGGYQNVHQDEDTSSLALIPIIVPMIVNATLCLLDQQQLNRAGYSSGWMTLWAFVLAPGYLFLRAKRLRETPSYGFVWIASFIAGLFIQSL